LAVFFFTLDKLDKKGGRVILSIEEAHESNASKFTVIGVFKDSFAALAIQPIYFIGLSVLSYFCIKQVGHSRAFLGINKYYHHDTWVLMLIINTLIATVINLSAQIIIAQYILRSQECGSTADAEDKISLNPITIIARSYRFVILITFIFLAHHFILASVGYFIVDNRTKGILFLLSRYLKLNHIMYVANQMVSLPFSIVIYFFTFLVLLHSEKSLKGLEVFRYAKKLLAHCYSKILLIICLAMVIWSIYSYFMFYIFYVLGLLYDYLPLRVFYFPLRVLVLNTANAFMLCFYYIIFAVTCIDLEKSYLARKHISQEV
jgi:hypothetical protein